MIGQSENPYTPFIVRLKFNSLALGKENTCAKVQIAALLAKTLASFHGMDGAVHSVHAAGERTNCRRPCIHFRTKYRLEVHLRLVSHKLYYLT